MTALLNTTIMTGGPGIYELTKIDLEVAKNELADGFDSFVGHQSTCDVLNALFGGDVTVEPNRGQYEAQHGEYAVCFKLNGRPAEGKILTAEEIEEIGYEFYLMKFHGPPGLDQRLNEANRDGLHGTGY